MDRIQQIDGIGIVQIVSNKLLGSFTRWYAYLPFNEKHPYHLLVLVYMFIPIFLFSGCCKGEDVVINDSPIIIGNKWAEFQNSSFFSRRCNSASIRIELSQEWEPVPPWDRILMNDGRRITPNVHLVSDTGKIFAAKIFGIAGGMLGARFEPEIPKNISIEFVKIQFDKPMLCKRIVWHDYDLK